MSKEIHVDISPAGKVTIDAKGFKGQGCASATEAIEIAIGGAAAKKKTKKPDFFAPAGSGQTVKRTF